MELFFDDMKILTKTRKPIKIVEPVEDDPVDLDNMLDDDYDDDDPFTEKDEINKKSSLKIADDDFVDGDDIS